LSKHKQTEGPRCFALLFATGITGRLDWTTADGWEAVWVQARTEWPAAQLAHAVGLPVDALRARIMFWINQGVIAEERTAAGLVRSPPLASMVLIPIRDQLHSQFQLLHGSWHW